MGLSSDYKVTEAWQVMYSSVLGDTPRKPWMLSCARWWYAVPGVFKAQPQKVWHSDGYQVFCHAVKMDVYL